jgi:polyribonucleotide nucleotidyltransferase
MVESEAELLSEDQMLGAVVFGHDQQQVVIQNINDLVKEAGKPRWDWQPEAVNDALNARVAALAESRLSDAYRITDKQERYAQVDVIKSETIATLVAEDETWTLTNWAKSCTLSRKTLFVAAYWQASRVSMAVKKT